MLTRFPFRESHPGDLRKTRRGSNLGTMVGVDSRAFYYSTITSLSKLRDFRTRIYFTDPVYREQSLVSILKTLPRDISHSPQIGQEQEESGPSPQSTYQNGSASATNCVAVELPSGHVGWSDCHVSNHAASPIACTYCRQHHRQWSGHWRRSGQTLRKRGLQGRRMRCGL